MPTYAAGRGGVGRATPPAARGELGRRRDGERRRSSHLDRCPPWGAAAPGRGKLGLLGEVAHTQASFFSGAAAPCCARVIRARRIRMELASEQHSCEPASNTDIGAGLRTCSVLLQWYLAAAIATTTPRSVPFYPLISFALSIIQSDLRCFGFWR